MRSQGTEKWQNKGVGTVGPGYVWGGTTVIGMNSSVADVYCLLEAKSFLHFQRFKIHDET